MIFVDTSAWLATYVRWDTHSGLAQDWFVNNTQDLVTTDYVIDELLTLLRSRRAARRALQAGADLWGERYARIEYVTREDLVNSWETFRRYDDKLWSFTDCTSRVVMERLGITTAFAFDAHFRQFGSIAVVP